MFFPILLLSYVFVTNGFVIPSGDHHPRDSLVLAVRDGEHFGLPNRIASFETNGKEVGNDDDDDDDDDDVASKIPAGRNGGRCGGEIRVQCEQQLCCSPAGYCGTSIDYCRSPDCQIGYGRCDADKTPQGLPTKDIPRPKIGSVAYGETILSCKVPYTFAMTFDDGPNEYTCDLLDILDKYHAKATFFITGVNSGKGQIDDFTHPWGSLIQRMHYSGHQLASHTWSHQDLNAVTPTQRRDQMLKNEAALRNIIGAIPTYMRPPYSKCNETCLKDMAQLGYHVISFNMDTADYLNDNPEKIQQSKDIVNKALSNSQNPPGSPFLAIGHDIHAQTVYNLTEYILQHVNDAGYRAVTVGDCLDDPRDNWYRWDYRTSE